MSRPMYPLLVFIFDIFRWSSSGIFLGMHLALMAGVVIETLRERALLKRAGTAVALPSASVVVPLRNEAHRVGPLLESLAALDYPSLEFVFVDDRSTDGTGALLEAFAAQVAAAVRLSGASRSVRVLRLSENPGPNFKQYALTQGIAEASGEYLFLTDADCWVKPEWARAMAARLSDERIGAVIGPVFKQPEGPGFFQLYQAFDHAVRYIYLFASAGLGSPGGGFGNNMAVRRTALDAVGGYGAVPFSVTEDAALVSLLRSRSSYLVRGAAGADTRVMTSSERSWGDFLCQTQRWNNGGLFSPDPSTRFSFALMMIIIAMGILSLPLLPLIPSLWPLPVSVYMVISMDTVAALSLGRGALPRAGIAYLLQLLFTPVYFAFLTLRGLGGARAYWKGTAIE